MKLPHHHGLGMHWDWWDTIAILRNSNCLSRKYLKKPQGELFTRYWIAFGVGVGWGIEEKEWFMIWHLLNSHFSIFHFPIHSRIQIKGSEVIPVPLFNVLDGKCSDDYVARVEPSAIGGEKMAEFLLDIVDNSSVANAAPSSMAPTTSLIHGRM
jgi:hypothetical protein